jgi:hypothetical protein
VYFYPAYSIDGFVEMDDTIKKPENSSMESESDGIHRCQSKASLLGREGGGSYHSSTSDYLLGVVVQMRDKQQFELNTNSSTLITR